MTVFAAWRTEPRYVTGPGSRGSRSAAAVSGRAYERKVLAALGTWATLNGARLEKNPWFEYNDGSGGRPRICSPDGLLFITPTEVVVVEVKLRYVAEAFDKLRDLYCPAVAKALRVTARPLVVVKITVPGAPPAADCLGDALRQVSIPLFQWLGRGKITW